MRHHTCLSASRIADPFRLLIDEIHRKLGRNLLRFQQIESGLKLILPYIRRDGSASGDKAFRGYRDAVATMTLGLLTKELVAGTNFPPGFVDHELTKMVEARNQLVHHFFQTPGLGPSTSGGIDAAMKYLDAQYKETEEFSEFVRHLCLAVLLAIVDTQRTDNPEPAQVFQQLLAALPPTFELILLSSVGSIFVQRKANASAGLRAISATAPQFHLGERFGLENRRRYNVLPPPAGLI